MSHAETTAALATVYVDPHTGLYHDDVEAAGPDPTRYSRSQADLVGFDPCPTCFACSGGVQA